MTNLEKMCDLVGMSSREDEVVDWAYNNRITVFDLPDYDPFEAMETTVSRFYEKDEVVEIAADDEFKVWKLFLKAEFVA